MYTIRRYIEIDAGHRVPFHESGCRRLHGHRYRITAEVGAPELKAAETREPDAGMVVDFGVVKAALMEVVHNVCDHRLLLWENDPLIEKAFVDIVQLAGGYVPLPCIPTAEELARYWGQELQEWLHLEEPRIQLVRVEVRETPTSTAIWEAPGVRS